MHNWDIQGNWENNIICHLSVLVNTLSIMHTVNIALRKKIHFYIGCPEILGWAMNCPLHFSKKLNWVDNLLITYKTVLTKSAPQKNLWTISGAYKKEVLLKGREEKVEEERTWFYIKLCKFTPNGQIAWNYVLNVLWDMLNLN